MDHLNQKTVAIVVDGCFGKKILQIAPQVGAIWVIDSKINTRSVLDARNAGYINITLVTQIIGESKEDQLYRIINEVDEHEGPQSKDEPYEGICVFDDSESNIISEFLLGSGFKSATKCGDYIFWSKADALRPL